MTFDLSSVPPPYTPVPLRKFKVGFQVRVTLDLGDVPPTPPRNFFGFRIEATLDYVGPLGNVTPPHPTAGKFLLIFGSKQ